MHLHDQGRVAGARFLPLMPPTDQVHVGQLQDGQEECPEIKAGVLSKMLTYWLGDLLRKGYKRPLEPSDLYRLGEQYHTKNVTKQLEGTWGARRVEESNWPLIWALSDAFGKPFYMSGFLKLFGDLAAMTTPFALKCLIRTIESSIKANHQDQSLINEGYMYCFLIFFLQIVNTLLVNSYFSINFRAGMKSRTAMNAMVYGKAQRLSAASRQNFSSGQIVNLISGDSNRIEMATLFLHYIWSGPLQLIVILAIMLAMIGPSVFVGVLLFAISIPIQSKLTTWLSKYRKDSSQISDKRVRLMQEVIQGIRVIKYYAWESSFLNELFGLRSEELKRIKKTQNTRAYFSMLAFAVPVFATIFTILAYYYSGHELKPDVIFPIISYFNMLKLPLALLPMSISMMIDAKVALKRIQDFLQAEELVFRPTLDEEAEAGILAEAATFEWVNSKNESSRPVPVSTDNILENQSQTSLSKTNTLGPIELKIPKGSLVAVIGAVGSGKSSLLNALVGEMTYIEGKVVFSGRVGYSPQQAWIQNKNVRENILFGRPYDQDRYDRVIDVCALRKDFEILPDGDLTEIGEKGVNLSGGQKQRISLARIIYSDSDIVLLDDPLSAVDAHVGRHIFEKCLCGELAGKTRVLVTHQLHILPRVDYVIVMDGLQIVEQGTFSELMGANGSFNELMRTHGGLSEGSEDGSDQEIKPQDRVKTVEPIKKTSSTEGRKLMTAEERMTGAVSWNVYKDYVHWGGGLSFVIPAASILVLYNICRVGTDTWLANWAKVPPTIDLEPSTYALVYVMLGVAQGLFGYLVAVVFMMAGLRASTTLHELASKGILASPVSFFDSNPLGRIINRFSKDMDTVDNQIQESLRSLFAMLGIAFGSFALVSFVSWAFIPPLILLIGVYYWVQNYYRASTRELKRLDALARSPLYAQVSETLTGLATIRAFREEQRFIQTNAHLADLQNQPFFLQQSIQRWLGVRLESVSNMLVLSACLACYYFKVEPEKAGLAIGYALGNAGVLNWMIRQISETESNIIASERLGHYVNLQPEPTVTSSSEKPVPEEWPSFGSIEFQKVTMRYRPELEPVLQSVNLSIRAGERIGIVGRTGAGKSSIMVALFRMVGLSEGKITIDGYDTGAIPLDRLRSSLSIIPQDPVVFAGTIRSNLDPFEIHTDSELWLALKRSHLGSFVSSLDGGLDSVILEGGENLSVGQRQLLCLARAILRRNKILVLDEATANIDLATDALIQKSIRSDFTGCTILTIAHRLNTVIDYDRILVLDHGKLAEFDAPRRLLADENSMLSRLARETGSNNETLLKTIASSSSKP